MKGMMEYRELETWFKEQHAKGLEYDLEDMAFMTIAELYTPYEYSSQNTFLAPDAPLQDEFTKWDTMRARLQEVWTMYQKMSFRKKKKVQKQSSEWLRFCLKDNLEKKNPGRLRSLKRKLKMVKKWL